MHKGKHMDQGGSTGWSEFMAGAFIGAGVALLFAPRSGAELRAMLYEYASRVKEDVLEKGQEALDTAMEQGKEYYGHGEELVQEAERSAREFAKQGAKKGKQAVKDVAGAVKEFVTQAKEEAQKAGH